MLSFWSRPAPPATLAILAVACLGPSSCAHSPQRPGSRAWVARLELVASPGARREAPPEEPPYFWRGAPLVLELELSPSVAQGAIQVSWRADDGRVLGEKTLTLPSEAHDPATGEGVLRFEAPDPELLEPGIYRAEVRWLGPTIPTLPPPALGLTFGIGEREAAAVDPAAEPVFPWPPPRPASRHVIDAAHLGGGQPPRTLDEAADRLIAALGEAGYAEHAFFSIRPDPDRSPEGFALVTRLEQIFPDGRPRPDAERWRVELPSREVFSLEDLLRALFTAPEGHYRVIVFAVTGRPVAPSETEPTREEAGEWLGRGLDRLPRSLGELPWTPEHACTALIYQFRQVGAGREPEVNPPDAPPARLQLERTGILAGLGGGG